MNEKMNKALTIVSCLVIVIVAVIFITLAKSTYSLDDKYVVFRGIGNNASIIKSCKIGTDGKLESSCINIVSEVCSAWTTEAYGSTTVNINGTFNATTTVYCKSNSSDPHGYTWGCYYCPGDKSIMKWLVYAGGYTMPSSYLQDANCSTALVEDTSITDDKNCVPVISACYECKANSHLMKWSTNGDGDTKCPGGYKETTKTQAECVDETQACYECKADSNILKWKYDDAGDDSCPGGYNKTTKTQAECKVTPVNPPTGSAAVYFTWFLAIAAITCSVWFIGKTK